MFRLSKTRDDLNNLVLQHPEQGAEVGVVPAIQAARAPSIDPGDFLS